MDVESGMIKQEILVSLDAMLGHDNVSKLLKLLLKDLCETQNALENALAEFEEIDAKKYVHKLKGLFVQYGIRNLTDNDQYDDPNATSDWLNDATHAIGLSQKTTYHISALLKARN